MAIASIILHVAASPQDLYEILGTVPEVSEREVVPPDKVAAVLEAPAGDLSAKMKELANLPNVWNLELVFANYEDDLDSTGRMPCPPRDFLRRKK